MKIIEFQKIADILAKEYKITIQEGNSWAANTKERKLFYVKENVHSLPEEHILGFTLHEIAHIHYSTDIIYPPQNKELTHFTYNALEDISIEEIISKDYPNAGEILKSTKEDVINKLIKILPKTKISLHEKAVMYASILFDGRGYRLGIEKYEIVGEKVAEIMIRERKNILERKKSQDLMPIVKEIVDLLLKELGQPTEQEKNNMNRENNNANGMEEPTKQKKKLISVLKNGGTGWEGPKKIYGQYPTLINEITDQTAMIGRKVRNILKRNNAMEFGGKYKSGKLLTRRFVKIRTQKDRKPFCRRIIKSNKSYCFAIATDVSGSMFQIGRLDPMSYAISSMYMTCEALKMAKIERTAIVFGENFRIINKNPKDSIVWEDILMKIEKTNQNSTDIGSVMHACTEELKKSNAERKIMIILTDGSSRLSDMLAEKEIAKRNNFECLGISIGYCGITQMRQVFEKKELREIFDTTNIAEIGKAFLGILKDTIKQT